MGRSRGHRFTHVLVGIALASFIGACKSSPPAGAFQCINDGDCPPGCSCEADFVAVGICGSDSSARDCGGTCDSESACPDATECLLDSISGEVELYACKEPTGSSGGSGGAAGAGGAGGDCVPDFLDVGGSTESPVVWEEKFTCIDDASECFDGGASDNNEPITFELVQDGKNLVGRVVTGQGEGDIFEGELCGNEFRWVDTTPGVTNPERGCWTFTSTSFNKRSYAPSAFDCVGAGTKSEGSTPPDVISCEALGSDTVDVTVCPPAPPAAPEDDPL